MDLENEKLQKEFDCKSKNLLEEDVKLVAHKINESY